MKPAPLAIYETRSPEGHRRLVTLGEVDLARRPEELGFEHARLLSTRVPPELLGPDLLPTAVAMAKLDASHVRLCDRLRAAGVKYRYVGRHSDGGRRTDVYQVATPEAFDAAIEAWRGDHPWPIEVQAERGWGYFDRCIRPDALQRETMENLEVVLALKQAGADLSRPLNVEHVFCGPRKGREALVSRLAALGLGVVRRSVWRRSLVVGERRVVELRSISVRTLELRRLAVELSLDYDGWGAWL
jgi:hypothetical protein